jgi:hypothetical protein
MKILVAEVKEEMYCLYMVLIKVLDKAVEARQTSPNSTGISVIRNYPRLLDPDNYDFISPSPSRNPSGDYLLRNCRVSAVRPCIEFVKE